ncbi:MAG TPA: GAF domain-containing protein [Streptosporangiaceae bacterium]|nr:GAF domain-containing protein [Streptosporangiaceae bacterium]
MQERPEVVSGLLPQLHLDELLRELQGRLQAVLETRDQMHGLLEAVVAVGSGLDLETMLHRIVEAAVSLADARYGALGVVGDGERLAEFVPVGLDEHEISEIDHWPEGKGLLGLLIRDPRPLRLVDIKAHSDSVGFPSGHPPMRSFLGVPVHVRGEVFGNLYLTEKRDGNQFTADDEAVVSALGAAAGVAIENARLYDDSQRQQRWLRASSDVTTRLLSGIEPDDVFPALTIQALELSGADLAVVALPDSLGARLIIEFADGDGADAARGLVLPTSGSLSGRVLETGQPETVTDFAADERASSAARAAMSHIGPAVLIPLGGPGNVRGVFTIGRRHGASPFARAAVEVAASFATQAGIALELADRRRDAEQLRVFEDRDRIARDLHDQVIQRLYAAGMSLQGTVPMTADPAVSKRIHHVVDEMDQAIADIRTAIFSLHSRSRDAAPTLPRQIVALADEMTPMLGIAPAIRLGGGLDDKVTAVQAEHLLTVLREALSNVARHANASQVDVSVEANSELTLRVADDGSGIKSDVRRSGLANMYERAALLGGTLQIAPADDETGTGTVLLWRVPLS